MSHDRPMRLEPDGRSAPERADAEDLRAVIVRALVATPIDDDALRRGIWSFVGNERNAGGPAGQVIIALTDVVGEAGLTPASVHHARLSQVISWCVEAYGGHPGDPARPTAGAPSLPRPASNR